MNWFGTKHILDLQTVSTIAKKELTESLRDRRTLVSMLLLPMVIYSASILVSAEVMLSEKQALESKVFTVQSLAPLPAALTKQFHALEGFDLSVNPSLLAQAHSDGSTLSLSQDKIKKIAQQALIDLELDLVLVPSSTASLALDTLSTAAFKLYYDQTAPYAMASVARFQDELSKVSNQLRGERLRGLGLDESSITPLKLTAISVASAADIGGHSAALIFPVLLLFFITLSSFYPAVDLSAGEKERGTLATLLTAPINAFEIVLGKYLAVVAIGTFTGLINVGAMALTLWRAVASGDGSSQIPMPEISASSVAALLVAVVLTAMLIGGLMLITASLARSFRDANNLLGPVLFLALTPAVFALLPRSTLTAAWAAVPIANCVLLMKGILNEQWDIGAAFIVMLSTIAYSTLFLILAARIFNDERALFSLEGPRLNFAQVFRAPPEAGVGTAFTLVSIVFIGNYYGGLLIANWSPVLGIAFNQVVFQLFPALGFAFWMKKKTAVRDTLCINLPDRKGGAFAGASLIGSGAWLGLSVPILWLLQAWFPETTAAAENFKSALGIDRTPVSLLLLVMAFLPAVVEEITFRGVIFGQLRARMSKSSALVLQALLFGAVHGSLVRLLPTAGLGLMLGWVCLKTRSIWPAVLAHFLTNAIAIMLETKGSPEVMETLSQPSAWAFAGLGAVGLGAFIIGRSSTAPALSKIPENG